MDAITLNVWIEQFKSRFDGRALRYMSVHKAKIALQLKDKETGEIHLHELDYRSREAEDLAIILNDKKGGGQ
jgi:hypothetical protein